MKRRERQASMRSAGKKPGQQVKIAWSESTQFKVPIPKDEKERMAELRQYKILDTAPEENFDNITELAAQICQAPIALMTLVDSRRQWFKSRVGTDMQETPREVAFCAYAIMERDLFIVRDATKDKRFAFNPLVTSKPQIRFYAGAPLVSSENRALGTLCVLDRVPRDLTRAQKEALRILSRQVMVQLEMRRKIIDLKSDLQECRRKAQAATRARA